MIKYLTISTDCGIYKLSAIEYRGEYVFASLQIGRDSDSTTEYWDNDSFLVEKLYPYLKGEIEAPIQEVEDVFSNSKEKVLEIFEEAFKAGILNRN